MIKISLKTQSGHFLIANDATNGYRIAATPDGVGPWELFTVIPVDGRTDDSLRSGDQVFLQTHHGRYVMAQGGGGAAVTGASTARSIWETFTIEKRVGSGEIVQGNLVTLRTNNGRNFLMARNSGGSDVTAESTNRSSWESFAVEFWNPMLVRLRAHDTHYLAAENGGGREINATRTHAGIWETFTLANRSRSSGLHTGDQVCLQVWDGRFVSAESGGGGNLVANKNRAARFETFTIQKALGGEISLSDRVSFRSHNGTNYVMALNGGNGVVTASSLQAREWETFQLEAAELNPIPFSSAPTLAPRTGHPLVPPPSRVTGSRKLICFLIGFEDRAVDDSISSEDFRNFFFGEVDSVRAWVKRTSFNAFNISSGGTFGPMTVPWPYVAQSDQDYFSGLLRLAEAQGLVFRNLDTDREGIITGEELLFVVVDCTDIVGGGQKRNIGFTYDGVSYGGSVFTVGIRTRGGAIQGRAQLDGALGTISHEMSHMLFNLPDRYYQPFPPRGDVVATGDTRADGARLSFLSSDGSVLRAGSRIRVRVIPTGDFLVFDDSDRKYLNREASTGSSGQFFLERRGGGEIISHGDSIHLKAVATNRYVMAKGGGGHVVQVIAGRPAVWETFTVERDAGAGRVADGEPLKLKTTAENVYGRSFYLRAETDGRRSDPDTLSRGWWGNEWASSAPGNSVGGDYDIMDNDKDLGAHAAYDRIKLGWIVPRVLTPDNRACYVLRPSIDHAEAFILWDPAFPEEWYVVENRQQRDRMDQIPSSGLIISWVNESPAYWNRWSEPGGAGKFPAVISAAAPTRPPNSFIELVLLRNEFYKRRGPNTAFRSGTCVLPMGDGSRSRFRLSFRELTSGRVAFCIL